MGLLSGTNERMSTNIKNVKEFRLLGAENRSSQPCPYDVNTGTSRLTSYSGDTPTGLMILLLQTSSTRKSQSTP